MFCVTFEGLLRGDKARKRSFFVAIEFSFSEIWTVQPRSDSCPAEAGGRGWTVRPRLDSPDQGKCKFYQDKE